MSCVFSELGAVAQLGGHGDQGTFRIAPEKAPVGSLAVVTVRDRKTGEGITYTIADEWLPKILGWNKMDPAGRYDAAMAAEGLFTSQQAPRLP